MANKSHFNSGHIAMNMQKKTGIIHSSAIANINVDNTKHGIFIEDAVQFLKKLPDSSIQLILIDPPYNLDLDYWDTFDNYLDWAKSWLDQIFRVLSDSGNCVIFGGFQYQDLKKVICLKFYIILDTIQICVLLILLFGIIRMA